MPKIYEEAGTKVLSYEDAVIGFIVDIGEALKTAFSTPASWSTNYSIFMMMIEYLEALATPLMTNRQREILLAIEELFTEVKLRIEAERLEKTKEADTEREQREIDSMYDDLIDLADKLMVSIKLRYISSCVRKSRKLSEDVFDEEQLYRVILSKLYCNGLSEYMNEEEVGEFIWGKTKLRGSSSERSETASRTADTS
jgi:hypothetical protein